jgi:putative transposase
LFLVALRETWERWRDALFIVKPETVINWQKRRFKNHWTQKTNINRRSGRPKISLELQQLIKQMVIENYSWGAQKIFSEILKLGYTETQLSPRTVSTIKRIRVNDPRTHKKQQQWKTFLDNHRHSILAMDFFTIPTVSFKILYVFFIIDHARRKIVHFNITEHPTSQ